MQRNLQNRFRWCKLGLQECSFCVKEVELVCALGQTGAVHAHRLILPQVPPECRNASWLQPGCYSCMTVKKLQHQNTEIKKS